LRYCIVNKKNIMKGICFLALICFCGCAEGIKNEKKDAFFDKWTTLAENSQGHSPSAKSKTMETSPLLKEKKITSSPFGEINDQKLPHGPITLTMRQADLKSVLRAMAKSVGVNLLVKNELKGDISVDFRGVAWDKAFTGLLRTYGLSYIWEDNIIRVMTIEDVEQELKRKVQLRDIQWVEPLLEPVVVKIDYGDAAKLAAMLQDFLTKDKDGKPRGSIKIDEHTNSLIISAMRDDLTKILPIIEKLDKPTSQIQIKANIVETTKGVARDLGIMWGGYRNSPQGNNDLIIMSGGNREASDQPINPTGNQIGLSKTGLGVVFPAKNMSDIASASLGLIFGKIDGNVLEVQLQALQNDNKLNILSSPSITTMDHKKAYTENGARVPYVTTERDASGQITETTKFEDVVLRLEITPHVIDGKNLKMEILVKKDELDMTRKSSIGDPYIIKKETRTELIVKDGETIVISGLTKQSNAAGQSGVPWLKDIPLLGWAFKADSKSDSMEEVLIFITPQILPMGS